MSSGKPNVWLPMERLSKEYHAADAPTCERNVESEFRIENREEGYPLFPKYAPELYDVVDGSSRVFRAEYCY